MSNSTHEIGSRVERIASDYTGGRKGSIIEMNEGRARVQWDEGHPRTWVAVRFLKLIPIQPSVGDWKPFLSRGKTQTTERRRIELADGTVYYEYR